MSGQKGQRRISSASPWQRPGSSGRCSSLGFAAQDTRYYSTPAGGSSRAQSADSHSCGGVKFSSLNVDWEWTRYLQRQEINLANKDVIKKRTLVVTGPANKRIVSQSKHAHRLVNKCLIEVSPILAVLNQVNSVPYYNNGALLGLLQLGPLSYLFECDARLRLVQTDCNDSALQRRAAERRRRADLAKQLLDSRSALAQVDAALQQAGQLCRPEQLAPLLSTATSASASVVASSIQLTTKITTTTTLECPIVAKTFGRARRFVPGAGPTPRGQQTALSQSASVAHETSAPGKTIRHINDIFRIPYENSASRMTTEETESAAVLMDQQSGNPVDATNPSSTVVKKGPKQQQQLRAAEETFEQQQQPPQLLRRRAGRAGGIVGGGDFDDKPSTQQQPMSVTGRQAQLIRRMSTIEMVVHNEDGETEEVEIDVAEAEAEGAGMPQRSGSSISDRINRRRNSELAADIIRLSAAHRRREFVQLLNEHRAIVRDLQTHSSGVGGRRSNQRPPKLVGTIHESSVDKEKDHF